MVRRLFSSKNRAPHLGPYPLEHLRRGAEVTGHVAPAAPLVFHRPDDPQSIVNAMAPFQAMMDTIRAGYCRPVATIPDDLAERANHLKSFCYFNDASMVGIGPITPASWLETPHSNAQIDALSHRLQAEQIKSLAGGIDLIMADLKESMASELDPRPDHRFQITIIYEYFRDPSPDEPGADWIKDAQAERAALRANETACVIANYIRALGYDARSHSASCSELNLKQSAIDAGLAMAEGGEAVAPWLGKRFGIAVVSTEMPLFVDQPLTPLADQSASLLRGLRWRFGRDGRKSAGTKDPYAGRDYAAGAHPFETLTRVEKPTTYMDEPNIPRVPKKTDMFARSQFGDLGPHVQAAGRAGRYVSKSAPSFAQRRLLGALVLLQDGEAASVKTNLSADDATTLIKAASNFLGTDAIGMSRCPDWAWYSHDALGEPIHPPHAQAISMIIDQGYETMEGSSGDDWIAVSQSMRAYLRFSLIGGVIAQQLRNLGYEAKAHTVMDGEVLQPPLLLLAGLGEVSRIGEVILNPFLGPRLKSGVVTTNLTIAHDQPIDFGLQKFCASCNKCARECPSGAITAGPKLMFNGYEIWKSDSQKCASYRITNEGGAMCGRCMKTCPWNLEGLFAEAPFRWAAMNMPSAAPALAWLDDAVGNGGLNPTKKWWWDIEGENDAAYAPTQNPVHARDLQRDLKLDYADQTLAVYPANLAPPPYPYPYPMDREAGIEAYQAMITAEEYQSRMAAGDRDHLHRYENDQDPPVVQVIVDLVDEMAPGVTRYVLRAANGQDLPVWTAGAHVDIVVAPDMLRQYSLCGDPADRSKYEIAVLKEDAGRGGSILLHRIFAKGRRVFISKPIQHFPLAADAAKHILFGGGIGVTPMIAFAHSLHQKGEDFELHYSIQHRERAGFVNLLTDMHWADRVQLHVSAEGSRAILASILRVAEADHHVYVCGPDRYIQAVQDQAYMAGFDESQIHFEYFSTPEQPEKEDYPFTILLPDGKKVPVARNEKATDALLTHGIHVDVKCSDGICGVCQCDLIDGDVDHRDFVLSKQQQKFRMILCQSRAAEEDGTISIKL